MRFLTTAHALIACALLAACNANEPETDASSVSDGGAQADGLQGDDASTGDGAANFDATVVDPNCPNGQWCSALFPPAWTAAQPADTEGRFLHDFSYAGYKYGETPPTSPQASTVFDVVTGYSADATGLSDATAAIQAAIDAAQVAGGGIVYFPAGTYRLDGTLLITASRIVLRGAGQSASRLYFTKFSGMSNSAHIRFRGTITRSAPLPLVADGAPRDTAVSVADASSLSVGDELSVGWTISDDFIAEHDMTGTWTAFNGQWRAFFRRSVVAIDSSVSPARVTLDVPLRYAAKLRDQANLRSEAGYLSECGIESLGLSNAVAWDDAWTQHQVHVVSFFGVKDSWMRDLASFESPLSEGWSGTDTNTYHLQSSGIEVVESKRVTVTQVTLHGAQNRGSGGDGYLFEISRSSEILVADSVAEKGRHNFIQNWDFGTSGCVFLRCASAGGGNVTLLQNFPFEVPAYSEFHHSLAMANLVDQSTLSDGWLSRNRGSESTGSGQTSTGGVIWNARGGGRLQSMNFGWGYVIGTSMDMLTIETSPTSLGGSGTAPEDYVEGIGQGATLWPASLYEEQRARRLAP